MQNLRGGKAWRFFLFLTGVFFLWGGVSVAQQPQLVLKTVVEKEVKVKKKGQWALERAPVDKTGPGDVLVYTIAYQNAGKIAAVDAQIVNPVPRGVVYVQDTAEGQDAEITCSIDNSRSWHTPPVMVQMRQPNGSLENKPAPMNSYTHIRWVIKKPVLPGQSGRVIFKATVK